MKKIHSLLTTASLGLALLLTATNPAQAQPRSMAAPGGVNTSGFYRTGGFYGYGGLYGGGSFSDYYRSNASLGVGRLYGPSAVGHDSRSSYYPSTAAYLPQEPEAPLAGANTAQVRVLLPDAKAKVWFDGAATKSTGTERVFYTPPLTADAGTAYRIRASWLEGGQEVIQELVVPVSPGRVSVADFTKPVQEGEPPPPKK